MNVVLTSAATAGQVRLGMLTPSSNTVVEPQTQALILPLAGRVSVHFSRFRVTQIGLDTVADGQFALEPILGAAELLADARPTLIAWNGTAASWRGFETDDRLCAAIQDRTGIPALSAMTAFDAALKGLRVRRMGLVTPYTADVQGAIIRNLAGRGIEVVAEEHASLRDNFSFSEIVEEEVAAMCRRVAVARPDAVAIICTNMRGARCAAALEAELEIPVLDSVAVTLWGCLRRAGLPTEDLRPFGRLFGLSLEGQSAA